MADWLMTDIDDAVWERFKAKATAAGKSEEQIAIELIEDYVRENEPEASMALDTINEGAGRVSLDPVPLIRNDSSTNQLPIE